MFLSYTIPEIITYLPKFEKEHKWH